MNRPRLSPPAFTVGFCCTYVVLFALNRPLFLYYPLHGDFTWGWQVTNGAGPAIVWYGFMTSATVIGLLSAVCLPSATIERVFRNYLWVFPCAAMLTCVFVLRHFFV
jgi:hypothetical protein